MVTAETVDGFREHISGREVQREATVDDYVLWIRRFETWRGSETPDEKTLREFDTWLDDGSITDYPWTNSRGVSPPASYAFQTRVKALSALKLWLPYQYDESVDTNVQNIALGEPAPFDPEIVRPAEIRQTIAEAPDVCDNPHCQAAMMVGYDAIMRGIEVTRVRKEDFNPGEGSLYVRAAKGSNEVRVGLKSDTVRALKAEMEGLGPEDRPFENAYGRAWKADAWNNHFRRKHHSAGFHAFSRHSAITNRLEQGEDFGSVYRRARHANPSMTIRYAKLVGVESPDWAGAAADGEAVV